MGCTKHFVLHAKGVQHKFLERLRRDDQEGHANEEEIVAKLEMFKPEGVQIEVCRYHGDVNKTREKVAFSSLCTQR